MSALIEEFKRDHAEIIAMLNEAEQLGIGLVGLAGAEVRRRRKKKAVDKG